MSVVALLEDVKQQGVLLYVENEKLKYSAIEGGLTPELKQTLKAHKSNIVTYLTSFAINNPESFVQHLEARGIEPAAVSEPPVLSFAQQRMWFLNKLMGASAVYNIPMRLRFSQELDVDSLIKSLQAIIMRHQVLRTQFVEAEPVALQRINEGLMDIQVESLEQASAIELACSQEAEYEFDLEHDSLMRGRLFYCESDRTYTLSLVFHHSIFDGWSQQVLLTELQQGYAALTLGETPALTPLPIQYKDYSIWQRQAMQDGRFAQQLEFWQRQLADMPALLELPYDRVRPAEQTFAGRSHALSIAKPLADKIKKLSQRHSASLFITLQAVFALLLNRYSNQDDIAVGTPVANRNRQELEGLIGFFVNTLVLRNQLTPDISFTEFLQQTRDMVLNSFDNQDIPFEKLVDEFCPERTISHSPLFQAMFVLQNAPGATSATQGPLTDVSLDGLGRQNHDDLGVAHFDLTLGLTETEQGLEGEIEYNSDLFDASTIARMAQHYIRLLEAVVAKPNCNIHQLPMLTEQERALQMVGWNETAVEYPQQASLAQQFETIVAQQGSALAVTNGNVEMSYAELNHHANYYAERLLDAGVELETPVGICMERSVNTIVAVLAVIKAGGYYVPLDPDYPTIRLHSLIEDSGLSLVVVDETADIRRFEQIDALRVLPLRPMAASQVSQCNNPEMATTANSVAYLNYTSGSTGKPKGVLIEHQNVSSLFAAKTCIQVTSQDVVAQVANYSFDAFTYEVWATLLNGAKLVILDKSTLLEPELFANTLAREQISAMFLTTALFNRLALDNPQCFAPLRKLLFGGEAFSADAIENFFLANLETELIHVYGPTECTTFTTACVLEQETFLRHKKAPIGKPLANRTTYILNDGELLPVGAVGELFIGGDSVARGYLHNAALNAEKFVSNPLKPEAQDKLYRTGDLVKYLANGDIEFVGRTDHQVKIRGFRIELDEVGHALRQHHKVKDALVLVDQNDKAQKRLVAYLQVDEAENQRLAGELLDFAKAQLPSYMVPAGFKLLAKFPLNDNGKLDRKKLPAVELQSDSRPMALPETEVEATLHEIWSDLLNVSQISIDDNFFAIGGDSILSIQVVSRARANNIQLTVKQLFECQSIRALSKVAGRSNAVFSQDKSLGEQPLLPIQQWYLDSGNADLAHFHQSQILHVPARADVSFVRQFVSACIERHDVLSLAFCQTSGQWQGHYTPLPQESVNGMVQEVSLVGLDQSEKAARIKEVGAKVKRELELGKGGLARVVLFSADEPSDSRLLFVIHHLIVDGVSWRILFNDLNLAYQYWCDGQPIQLAAKTTSLQQWGLELGAYAASDRLQSQKPFWLRQLAPIDSDKAFTQVQDEDTYGTASTETIRLSPDLTRALLSQSNQAYNTQIQDLLVTALLRALHTWLGYTEMRISFESHGRANIHEGVDLSETLGWFTSVYPLKLALPSCHDSKLQPLADCIKSVKEQLRDVPDNGIGFGVLQHMVADKEVLERLAHCGNGVVFNYLGQLDAQSRQETSFSFAPEQHGEDISPAHKRSHQLGINGAVVKDCLQFNIDYHQMNHSRGAIEQLTDALSASLEELVLHCQSAEQTSFTPCDFPLIKELNQAELDGLQQTYPRLTNLYPTTDVQRGFIYHSLLEEGNGAYASQLHLDFTGGFEPQHFIRAWQLVVERHDIFRTAFDGFEREESLQIVLDSTQLDWVEQDWRQLSAEQQAHAFEQYRATDKAQPFDFQSAPLMRMSLFRLSDTRYRWLWTHHHSILDGWSVPVLFEELFDCYMASQQSLPYSGPAAPAFADYMDWLAKQSNEAAAGFWQQELLGFEVGDQLDIDSIATASDDPDSQVLEVKLPQALSEQIKQLANVTGVPLNIVIQAAWSLLLAKYQGNNDILFGQTVSGRPADIDGIERLLGLCINTLPVRVAVDARQTKEAFLQTLHKKQVDREAHGYLPLARIKNLAGLTANDDLFDVLLVVQNYPVGEMLDSFEASGSHGLGFQISDMGSDVGTHYGLALIVAPGQQMELKFEFQSEQYSESGIRRLAAHLQSIFEALVDEGTAQIQDICLTDATDLSHWQAIQSAAVQPLEERLTVHQLIERQVDRSATATALVDGSGELTYQAMNTQANRLAHQLVKKGVRPGHKVAVCLKPSNDAMVAFLAVLKCGAAYVPLDASYPAARLSWILDDCGATAVITSQAILDATTSFTQLEHVVLDDNSTIAAMAEEEGAEINVSEQDFSAEFIAYVIYTSGSTGKPKGVEISHRSLVNYLSSAMSYLHPEIQGSIVSSSLVFDATVSSMYLPLLAGLTVEFIPQQEGMIEALADYVMDDSEDLLFKITPSHLQALINLDVLGHECGAGHVFVVGGEPFKQSLLTQWQSKFPNSIFINEYGPTEATVGCAIHSTSSDALTKELRTDVPIGTPTLNTQLHVLDEQLRPLPVGIPGELYIGGEGLAQGYLNRPGLTAEKFIPNPYGVAQGQRLYRTGDLVRLLPHGALQFLRRVDEQVKVRGRRIELGEVAKQIEALAWVKEAVALVHLSECDETSLVAFVQLDSQVFDQADGSVYQQVTQALRSQLPAYMLPDQINAVEAIPLTINGKVDRNSLLGQLGQKTRTELYVAPRNQTEQTMVQLWQEILKQPHIGIHDDFFSLGGHSILATRLNSAIRATFETEISLKTLFDFPTIAGLCGQLDRQSSEFVLPAIEPVKRQPKMAMSFAQQRLWFIDQLSGGSAHYNMQGAYIQEGEYHGQAFKAALYSLLHRHEVLRTHFASADNEAWQVIEDAPQLPLIEYDLTLLDDEERTEKVLSIFKQEGQAAFDLNQELMLRVILIKVEAKRQLVMFTIHHIACDGWSMDIFQSELQAFYDAHRRGGTAPLAPLAIQYADYADWQREWMSGDVLAQQQAYWRKQLQDVPQLHSLPLDYKRPVNQTFRGKMFKQTLPSSTVAALQALCQMHDVTLFMLMETAFALLLSRYSNEQDIVVGSAVAGRGHQDLEGLIGFFINSVALRTDLSGNPTFVELLERNKQVVLDAYAHQDVPFDMLVEELRPERNLSYNPIFQIMFAVERHEVAEPSSVQAPLLRSIEDYYAANSTTRSDLQVQVNLVGEQASVSWIYNESLFANSSIENMAESYSTLLASIVASETDSPASVPGAQLNIAELNAVSDSQRAGLLLSAKGASLEQEYKSLLHHGIEQQSLETPNQTAIEFNGDALSYAELNAQANQLARCLIGLGIKQGDIVGVCVENSPEMLLGMLAILKAGAAYVALDPALPIARLEAMLEDCDTKLVLTQQELMAELDFGERKALPLDEDVLPLFTEHLEDSNLSESEVACRPDDLAYVVFTSGSTGRPKGVKVSHRAVMVYCYGAMDSYYDTKLKGALIATTYSVDMTVPSLFLPLLTGGAVVLPGAELSLEVIASYLFKSADDYLLRMTPSHAIGILALLPHNTKRPNAHKFVIGGEALHYATLGKLQEVFPNSEIINHYGPSEGVVGCVTNSELKLLAKDEIFGTVPIGKPMKGNAIYVLDNQNDLQIPGSVGELAIGGVGLSDGYLKSNSSQQDKFIKSRFSSVTDANGQAGAETLYRTGDLVRWLPDGNLTFLGRVDDQVSIRGYRIELGDIDSKLKGIESIKEATVVIADLQGQGETLVAYVVPTLEIEGEEDLEVHQEKSKLINYYREQLAQDLPNHMIPLIYVFLDHLPLSPNGKVNKAKLPEPDETDLHFESYVAPSSEMEKQLCELWQSILKLEQVGIEDNFFSLGGHSLLATSMVSALRQEHDIDIPVRMLFEFPTIMEFSSVVEAQLLNKNMDTLDTEEFIL